MSTSLQTTNYGFGKYAPDDLTSYLTDYNRAMDKIDGAIKGVSDVANEAKATGDSNLNNIASLSEGLTATNKNVENLGKTQTAQQAEINDLRESFDQISIGDFKTSSTLNFISNPNVNMAFSNFISLRKLSNGIQGFLQATTSANGALTMSKASLIDDLNAFEIAYLVNDVFELGTNAQLAYCIVVSSNGYYSDRLGAVYYDSSLNKTVFALMTTGTSLNIEENTISLTFIF